MEVKMWQLYSFIPFILCAFLFPGVTCEKNVDFGRNFSIDYDRNTFVRDGEPFRYISGSVHYFRVMESYWGDIFRKMRLAGLNAVQTYVEWGSHQPTPAAEFDFSGRLNLFRFLELAQEHGLLVILRTGPFEDAERDMGGLPPWLLFQKEDMKLRTSDLEFVYFVSRWFDHLLPRLKPFLYENGGPIIMVQVENEYGSYACDKNYTTFLRDLHRLHLGDQVVLFTTDGSGDSFLKCGAIPDTYPTVDFGTASSASVLRNFAVQRRFAPKGPLINSEYYPGWLDHWANPHSTVSVNDTADTLKTMLSLNANVNIYMFYGGTSFGFGSGSNADSSQFLPCPTSYDYDAPLNEAGDPTPKYFAIKRVISEFLPVPSENPTVSVKGSLGKILVSPVTHVLNPQFLSIFGQPSVKSKLPESFEKLKIGSGFVLYETVINFKTTDPAILATPNLKDRAYVFVDQAFQGVLSRQEKIKSMPLFAGKGQKLQILVENQGRPCYGNLIGESKGLGLDVTLAGQVLQNWTMHKIGTMDGQILTKYAHTVLSSQKRANLTEIEQDYNVMTTSCGGAGMFFSGNFTVANATIVDTFVRLDGWTKGFVWVNGFNLGRYWPVVGPQETLYLPAPILRKGRNSIVIFELERAPREASDLFITLTDKHVINASTPLVAAPSLLRLTRMQQKHNQLDPLQEVTIPANLDLGHDESNYENGQTITIALPQPSLSTVSGQPQIKFKSSSGILRS